MKMIKVCKKPEIREMENNWGIGQGVFYVSDCVGYLEESMWNEVDDYQRYSHTIKGKQEKDKAEEQIKNGALPEDLNLTHMSALIKRANGRTLWEMNLLVNNDDDREESEYIRTFVCFDQISMHEWTPEHDKEVVRLQKVVDEMNKKGADNG